MATCKTCRFIEHGIYFKQQNDSLTVKHCCNMDHIPDKEQPHLIEKYYGEEINWETVFSQKRKDRDLARKGEYYPACKNCWELQEQEIDEEDYISHITLANLTKCNSRCVYCYIGEDEQYHSAPQKYRLYPHILKMKEQGILKFSGSLRYMGGEPTLLTDFEQITNLFVENNIPEIYLPTSGIKYSKAMEQACSKVPYCEIYISIDSGCPETYKKIKRIDAYNIVLKSLKNYVENSTRKDLVISKYIALLGYNDTTEEIDKWLNEQKSIGIKSVSFDINGSYIYNQQTYEKYFKYLLQLKKYEENNARNMGFEIRNYSPYIQRLGNWEKDNEHNFKNAVSRKIVKIDISKTNINSVEKYLNNLIEKYGIWKKPTINLISNKEITETQNFEEILNLCYKLGFKITLSTKANSYSKVLCEALKFADIQLTVISNGKYLNTYQKISTEKVKVNLFSRFFNAIFHIQ